MANRPSDQSRSPELPPAHPPRPNRQLLIAAMILLALWQAFLLVAAFGT